ncbi:hypothetical protein Tco_0626990 [Tanacetum coccineum]|uniref:Uncharacterized protein n=1 Tax=Tanacetum coccineum TaxID=301880 RepID=A0ABQ4WLA3_9ASTR
MLSGGGTNTHTLSLLNCRSSSCIDAIHAGSVIASLTFFGSIVLTVKAYMHVSPSVLNIHKGTVNIHKARIEPSKKLKLRTETLDELRNYLRIVDFEQNTQDRESLEAISMITEFKVIDSPDGEYLIIFRANNHFRAFNTLWEILHILDRQDLYHLYRVVQGYYKHIPPTGLGLVLLGVHTLKLEDGTMIHMLAERRYPLSRELMIRMLDHGIEVEDESEIAITLIHLFILWTTEDGDNS